MNNSVKELQEYLKTRYGIQLHRGYLTYAVNFNKLDKGLKNLEVHHVMPRCCGGLDEVENYVKITRYHHRKLHQMILLSESLTEQQRKFLKKAYDKMCGKKLK